MLKKDSSQQVKVDNILKNQYFVIAMAIMT